MHILRIEKNGECDIKNPLHNKFMSYHVVYFAQVFFFFKRTCAVHLALIFVEQGALPFTHAQKVKV